MEYNIGDAVVYGMNGVCRIDAKESRNFEGTDETEYYRLVPVEAKSSAFYIPISTFDGRVRTPMTKEAIDELIDSIPEILPEWDDDTNTRKNDYRQLLQEGDMKRLIGLTRALNTFRDKQRESGKKLPVADEKSMHIAENIIYGEFAFVLGIPYEKVEDYIFERLKTYE
ncbi:MAG: hypothetical protein LBM87_04220 [Ruminococcus sp.]|nr:hypothetical protein [Ruminococcus sp.]